MRKKPWLITLVTLGLLLVPFVSLAPMLFYGKALTAYVRMLQLMMFVLLSIVSFTTAYGVWSVKRWGFYALLGLGIVTTVLDLYAWNRQSYKFSWWVLLDFAAVIAGVTLIVQENVRKPFFNPKIKWWETPNRIRVDIPATLFINNDKKDIYLLDISKSGCFSDFDYPLTVGQNVRIGISYLQFKFESVVTVVRKSESPRGYGLKFENIDKANEKQMKQIMKDLSAG